MTIEEAKKLDHFVCSECASDDDVKRSQNGFSTSPAADGKVRLLAVQFCIIGDARLFSLFIHSLYV